jgi:hypothetical protein
MQGCFLVIVPFMNVCVATYEEFHNKEMAVG